MRKVEQFQNVDCEEESNEENNEEIMIEEELDENHNIIELKSLENALSIYTLQIFDFDATLFDTPLPEDGCRQYEEKTGRPWPHQGWWGCPESLMDPLEILPGPAYDDFLKHINLPHTHTIVMTGRHAELKDVVLNILIKHKTIPATIVMKPINAGTSTLHYKLDAIRREASKLPNLKSIVMWEDRFEHAERFSRTRIYNAKRQQLTIEVHYVQPGIGAVIMRNENQPRGRGHHRGRSSYHHYQSRGRSHSWQDGTWSRDGISVTDIQNADYTQVQRPFRSYHSQQTRSRGRYHHEEHLYHGPSTNRGRSHNQSSYGGKHNENSHDRSRRTN